MGDNNLNKKIIERVRNRIVISNLESEEKMKLNKKKQIISIAAVAVIMLAGGFFTVNAATNGELANNIKNTIKVVLVKDDGTENEVEGKTYTDSNNHTIVKYETENNGTKQTLEADKTNLDKENLTINETIKNDETSVTIDNAK